MMEAFNEGDSNTGAMLAPTRPQGNDGTSGSEVDCEKSMPTSDATLLGHAKTQVLLPHARWAIGSSGTPALFGESNFSYSWSIAQPRGPPSKTDSAF